MFKLLSFGLIVRATEAVDRSDFSNVVWWPYRVYGYGLPVDMGMTMGAIQGDGRGADCTYFGL